MGRMLASKLDGYHFVDLDRFIEQEEGRTIPEIFAEEGGEQHFRQLEHKYIQEVIARWDKAIVSTGGGTPCFHGNMEIMNGNGVTLYLKLPPGMLASRVKGGKTVRPLLQGKTDEELLAYITETLAKREPCYEQANVIVANPSKDIDKLLRIIEPYFHQN